MTVRTAVRAMAPGDIETVLAMAAGLSAHEGAAPPGLTRAELTRWAFGAKPRLAGLVAERAGAVVGYALYHDGFHIGHGRPGTFLMDLYVVPAARRGGVARALLGAVARRTLEDEGSWIAWQVQPTNAEALAFYKAVGGRRFAAVDFELAGEALTAAARLEDTAHP